jgi:hypothetical protein
MTVRVYSAQVKKPRLPNWWKARLFPTQNATVS